MPSLSMGLSIGPGSEEDSVIVVVVGEGREPRLGPTRQRPSPWSPCTTLQLLR